MTEWMEERIPFLVKSNWLYQIICFFMGKRKKKLSYKDMYILLYGLNRNNIKNEKEAKELSMLKVLEIYKSLHNNKLPNEVKI